MANRSLNRNKDVPILVESLFRSEYGKIVSYLTSKFGLNFLEYAQDVVQDTLLIAQQKWSIEGIPKNPEAWLFVVSKNKAINVLRRERKKQEINYDKFIQSVSQETDNILLKKEIEDGLLRMIFACCTLDLPQANKILFILKTLCGFSRKELSKALLLKEETVKKRLYRTTKALRECNLELSVPEGADLENQLNTVCQTLYLVFNEGYNSSDDGNLIRKDVCFEAMRLVRLLLNYFPSNTKIHALFGLMCFHTARFESRIDDNGAIVLFKDQSRQLWNRPLINAGVFHLSQARNGENVSAYHLEAGIAAEHCLAKNYESTNWELILKLYSELYKMKRSPIILLNIAIVKSQMGRLEESITELEYLKENDSFLSEYYLLYATLGELYVVLGKISIAQDYFRRAMQLTDSGQERDLMSRKTEDLEKVY